MSLAKFLNVIELRSGKPAREPAQPVRMAQFLGASVLAVPWAGRARAWRPHAAELGLAIACYLVYFLSRGAVFPNLDQVALQNTSLVIAAEKSLGIFWEPGWQAWVLEHVPYLALVLNWAYIITYWPVVLGIGLVIYVCHRQRYYYYRTAILIILAAALLTFAFFPVAPPFTSTGHFVDTIQTYGPAWYGSSEMSVFYNTTAAMPSLHFSWTLVFGVLFFRHLRGWHKLWGPAYPALTLFVIVITGNHFFLDAIAGGLLAVAALLIVELTFRRRNGADQRHYREHPH